MLGRARVIARFCAVVAVAAPGWLGCAASTSAALAPSSDNANPHGMLAPPHEIAPAVPPSAGLSGDPGERPPPAAPPVAASSPAPPPQLPTFPYHQPVPAWGHAAPAVELGNLSPLECRRELERRGLPVIPHKTNTPGIAYALRLAGPLHGVRFVTAPAPSRYGLCDCRLALALDELATVLAEHRVTEVQVDNMYRPGARIGGRGRRSQHSYGLAIDITFFRLADGMRLYVEQDFHAQVGDVVCGPEAVMTNPTQQSITLRNVVCAVARRGIFHHMLTPGTDRAHRNHLHFDIQRDATPRPLR